MFKKIALSLAAAAFAFGASTSYADDTPLALKCPNGYGLKVTVTPRYISDSIQINDIFDPTVVGLNCTQSSGTVYVLNIPGMPQFNSMDEVKVTIKFIADLQRDTKKKAQEEVEKKE